MRHHTPGRDTPRSQVYDGFDYSRESAIPSTYVEITAASGEAQDQLLLWLLPIHDQAAGA